MLSELLARGSGPYFYLPKMESHLEARLWNDIFVRAQQKIACRQGSIKALSDRNHPCQALKWQDSYNCAITPLD